MTRTLARLGLVVFVVSATYSVVAAGAVGPVPSPLQANQRTVVVSVLGRNDVPVPDLVPGDFTVREDGVVREVVRVLPADAPATIALLIDDSQAAMDHIRELRQALTAFANLLADQSPVPAMRLTTFGARPTTRVDFTPTFSGVSRAVDRITPQMGSGSTMMDAIIETCRDLRTRKLTGAVIVAFIIEESPEFSNATHQQVTEALKRAGASLWTITLADAKGNGGDGDQSQRGVVTGDVTVQSGGRNRLALTGPSLPRAFEELANVLLSRYAVTYGRPDSLIPPTRLELTARDRAWKVQVPRWPAQ